MKYITLTGGLGNQMFIYAFCLELRQRGYKAVLFKPYSDNSKKYGHQGYELKKLFDVEEYDGFFSKIYLSLLFLYTYFLKLFPARLRTKFYRLLGIEVVTVPENFIYYPEVFDIKYKNQLFRGTWQSESFFANAKERVVTSMQFNKSLLSEQTRTVADRINQVNSVSIHIRRGDYLSNQYANGFAGVCTDDYYRNAVSRINLKVSNPEFYVFTDDKEWVNEHFKIENAHYIVHNAGKDSWQDMYLMSQCKHNIIANSSFSWWGAWLNNNPNKIVIAPKLWWRLFEKDDVVPENWIRI